MVSWRREEIPTPQLSVVPAGISDQFAHGFSKLPNEDWLDRVAADFDLVIVDLPEVSSASSCAFQWSDLDGVIFVLAAESTSDIAAQKSLRQIREDGVNVLGIAFNKCRTHLPKWLDKRLGD